MAKLGYTWYPKDWGNSEAVFELTLTERGLYRELIDMAMLNDNTTVINHKVWARKFGSSNAELEDILITLRDLKLIEVKKDSIFIPSCEPRLNLSRGGRSGGKKSKPTDKSKENLKKALPKASTEALPKPKEKKDKVNIKEKKERFLTWFNQTKFQYTGKEGKSRVMTSTDENNFKKLLDVYKQVDFDIAVKNLYKSKWAEENNMRTISHFLRIENFNKYLEQGDKQSSHKSVNNQPAN